MTKAELKEASAALGFSAVGVCDAVPAPHIEFYRRWLQKGFAGSMGYLARHERLKADPRNLLDGASSVVMVRLDYNVPNPPSEGMARIARYALGRDYHKVMRGKLRRLAGEIESRIPGCKTRVCVDSAPLLEREYGQLAGLGWFGKNSCLIDSRSGSWFFLGALLTTHHFPADEPAVGGCGSCTRCIDACPTGAIVFDEDRWQVDSRRCISYLTIEHKGPVDPELANMIGDWTFGCDVCQEVCPFNEPRETQPLRATPTREGDFWRGREWPPLTELAEISHERWDEITRGSAVRRAGHEGLKRNARINLENLTSAKAPVPARSAQKRR